MDPFTERTPRVVSASKLHRAAARRKQHRFLAEGANSVEAAIATGAAAELFHTAAAGARFSELLADARRAGLAVSPVTDRAADSLADTVTSTGLFAVCEPVVRPFRAGMGSRGDDPAPAPGLVAVGQALAEPGNVGTLIRVADALGADEVWLTEDSVDPENPKAVRASAGSVFHVPVLVGVPEGELVPFARSRGLQVLVATGDGEVDLERSEGILAGPSAWVFGNESHGVPPELSAAADARVRIPLRGRAESLNITTAAAICLHTSVRVQSAPSGRD